MSRESEIANILRDDLSLLFILTGGIYTDEEIGIQGFRRGSDSVTDSAFDSAGELKPCAVVREGSLVPYGNISSVKDGIWAYTQPIEIYFYQNRGKTQILEAKQRSYELLLNRRLTKAYPLLWTGDTPIFYDVGPIANSTTVRQDWRCVSLRKPEPV